MENLHLRRFKQPRKTLLCSWRLPIWGQDVEFLPKCSWWHVYHGASRLISQTFKPFFPPQLVVDVSVFQQQSATNDFNLKSGPENWEILPV